MSVILIEDISHVRFSAPDLSVMRGFLEDFGLTEAADPQAGRERLFMRGLGASPFLHATEPGDPGFLALGLRAATTADVERIAAHDGVAVEPLDAPGGGLVARLRDPDGFLVEVVAGQRHDPSAQPPEEPGVNRTGAIRRARTPVRTPAGPSSVLRLGHCVLDVSDFAASRAWYQQRFGFIISDTVELQPGFEIGAFMRCDRGREPTDHHTLFLLQGQSGARFNHAAFEVAGLNDLMAGHDFLAARRHRASWGVGRHILGSQVFDYWRDPWGHELEHWTDGDVFTADDPSGRAGIAELLGVQWGDRHPMMKTGAGS
jgi:catechol 2,3-dioxygenase-like lactoylglutathione lyase family enzyme